MCLILCSPTPVGLSSLANEVIALLLAYMQGSSYECQKGSVGQGSQRLDNRQIKVQNLWLK